MPAGRRSTKSTSQRKDELIKAIGRSGLTGLEVVQLVVEWYGWAEARIEVSSTVSHRLTNRGIQQEGV